MAFDVGTFKPLADLSPEAPFLTSIPVSCAMLQLPPMCVSHAHVDSHL